MTLTSGHIISAITYTESFTTSSPATFDISGAWSSPLAVRTQFRVYSGFALLSNDQADYESMTRDVEAANPSTASASASISRLPLPLP